MYTNGIIIKTFKNLWRNTKLTLIFKINHCSYQKNASHNVILNSIKFYAKLLHPTLSYLFVKLLNIIGKWQYR